MSGCIHSRPELHLAHGVQVGHPCLGLLEYYLKTGWQRVRQRWRGDGAEEDWRRAVHCRVTLVGVRGHGRFGVLTAGRGLEFGVPGW